MNKPKPSRKINKNLFWGRLRLAGYFKLEDLGQMMNPPISRFRLCTIINTAKPDHRLKEIAALLGSNIQTLFPTTEE